MKKYLFIFAFFALFESVLSAAEPPAAENAVRISFTGGLAEGGRYFYNVRSTRTENYEMQVVGSEKQPIRRDVSEVVVSGELFYLSRTTVSGVLRREFHYRIDSLSSRINGVRMDFPELTSRTISIVYGSGAPVITFLPVAAGNTADAVLGGKKSAPDTADAEKNALPLLRRIFSGPAESPVNYLGSSISAVRGRHFDVNNAPLLAALQARGIPVEAGMIDSFGEYAGRTVFYGIPVDRVNLLAQGRRIPGYDFKFEVSMLVPSDKTFPACGPIRISRRAMEVVNLLLPESDPLFSGSKFEQVRNDMTDLILIPADRMPAEEAPVSGGGLLFR